MRLTEHVSAATQAPSARRATRTTAGASVRAWSSDEGVTPARPPRTDSAVRAAEGANVTSKGHRTNSAIR